MRSLLLVALAALAGTAGCGGEESCGTSTDPQSGTATAEIAYLTDVTVAGGDCDTVEFEFRDALPGYRVEYENADTALTEDGSGNRIDLGGEAFLVVRLEPARTGEATDTGEIELTYTGPRRLDGDGEPIVGVVRTGDFEAVVRWTIGLSERAPFTARVDGRRLVVEIG